MTQASVVAAAEQTILTTDALDFVHGLVDRFGDRRRDLLAARAERATDLRSRPPGFLEGTRAVREGSWRVPTAPADLTDRRVEITGPTDRKMMINALNSGASCFMADLEDATSPTWANIVEGQVNLRDAARRTISFTSPDGREYALAERTATLLVRPRGWHLDEVHLERHGAPLPASLVDAGLFLFHNAQALLDGGTGPYLYLPKLESHTEAALWHDVLAHAEGELGLASGSVRVTVLIETILAAFEMEEILHALGEHATALNCGRWDYIFSVIKKLGLDGGFVLPDRAQVTMETHMMRSYSRLAVQSCHRHGAHAIGGMSAFIPVKGDEEANARAFEQVRRDKEREARDGHDGTWVAHPGLVPVALAVFDELMPAPNQLDRIDDIEIGADDLLRVPDGQVTRVGLESNVSVALQYLAAWLEGRGAVPINNLMEDAATAEISRAQLWQWAHNGVRLADTGETVTTDLVETEIARAVVTLGPRVETAAGLLRDLATADRFEEFLTLPAYRLL